MKLWYDDIRRPPDESWVWARTNEQAIEALKTGDVKVCSLDHDMGLHDCDPDVPDADMQRGRDPDHDGYGLVVWMIDNDLVPEEVTIHSWNPVGARRMQLALAQHGVVAPYLPYQPRVA